MARRPELVAPPEIYYDELEAVKYASNSRVIEIQSKMSERAIELLHIPDDGQPRLLLDIGCGSGLSGEVLSNSGHEWVGLDISPNMLKVGLDRDLEGDLLLHDAGTGCPFRPGTFDGAVSISAIQWLFNAETKDQVPFRRLTRLFETLYSCLKRGSRVVFQFYPSSSKQMEMITTCATKCGFTGGLVVDYPNSKRARKYYLCLLVGPSESTSSSSSSSSKSKLKSARSRSKPPARRVKSREWIQAKKDSRRRQGKDTVHDSKYTGRKRRDRL